jgi:hypothetical protein
LKIWITPFASVAMLEKLALLKIARCRAPAFSSASSARKSGAPAPASAAAGLCCECGSLGALRLDDRIDASESLVLQSVPYRPAVL